MPKHILILGAGVSGLAAAWKLLQHGDDFDVTIVERDAVPGGLAKTIEWNGYLLDLGPHRFHTEIPEIRAFIKTFCEERMARVPRFSRMYLNGHYVPYPIKPLATLQALGLANSVAFFASTLGVLFAPKSNTECSYADYVRRYYGSKLYEHIFEPFAEKVWGLPPDTLDGEVAKVRLRGDNIWDALLDGLFSRSQTYVDAFLYPPKGIGEIPQQFADEVVSQGGKFLYEHTVRQIHCDNGRIRGVTIHDGNAESFIDCDVLLSTLPLPATVNMMQPALSPETIAASNTLRYRALVLLYLIYPKPYHIRDTWLYYPEKHVPFSRISVPENFTELNRAPDKTCLCLEFPCEVGDTVWNSNAETLAEQASQVLIESGLVDRPPSEALAVQVSDGYPLYTQGYQQKLDIVMASMASFENLIVTGRQGLFRHNNTDQSIQMGLDAAEHLIRRGNDLPSWYSDLERYKDYRIVD